MNKLNLAGQGSSRSFVRRAQLVSILSGKGGVGKSVLAFNLAERIGSCGRRVLLVDADFSSGNLHILANLNCDIGLRHFVSGQLSVKEAVTSVSENIDVLAAVGDPWTDPPTAAQSAELVRGLREQCQAYDFVLLDHASGITSGTTVIAHGSDFNLLVLVPELTSISDAYGLLKYLIKANDQIDCSLLLNRVSTSQEADYIHQKFIALTERFLGRKPGMMGVIPEDNSVRKAIASQQPVAAVDLQAPVLQALSRLAQKLTLPADEGMASIQVESINKTTASADIRG